MSEQENKAKAEAEALQKIQNAHQLLQETKVQARDARKEARDAVDAATAHLKGQIEAGIPANAQPSAVAVKLQNVELAWQNFEDAQAAAKELRKTAREATAQARQQLADAVADSKQLTLPNVQP